MRVRAPTKRHRVLFKIKTESPTDRRSVPDDSDKAGRCGNPTLPVGAQWKDPEPAARLGVLTH